MTLKQTEGKGTTSSKLSLDSILQKWSKGAKRLHGLKKFANVLQEINSGLDFPPSSRGWCYILENKGYINKGEFNRAQKAINECRELGYLSINFCREDGERAFEGVEKPTDGTIIEYSGRLLNGALNADEYYIPDWWDGERYYIQMLVEKGDLKELFRPICEEYHIPIATASGQSDINQRAAIAQRFAEAEKRGLQCVLLYCRDFDPWGDKIAKGIRKNIEKLSRATGYSTVNLKIDTFGLKPDFIAENNLTWVDNLITGSKKDMTKSYYCYNQSCKIQYPEDTHKCSNCGKKLYVQPRFVREYITQFGTRKCEAQALVVAPEQGRELCRITIEYYLGHDSISRFAAKRQKVKEELDDFRRGNSQLFGELEQLVREAGDSE